MSQRIRTRLTRAGRSGRFGVATLLALSLAAAPAAMATDDIPRRHDGKPDLSGTYDIATLTPTQRPGSVR